MEKQKSLPRSHPCSIPMLSKSSGDDEKHQRKINNEQINALKSSAEKKNQIAKKKKNCRIHRNMQSYCCEVLPELRVHGQREAKKLPGIQILHTQDLLYPSLNRAGKEQKELILHSWEKTEGPKVSHESVQGQVKKHLLSCRYIGRFLTILNTF